MVSVKNTLNVGLFIGRFQPFHNGHLSAIEEIAKETDLIIVGIGSAQYSHTFDNPFTVKERAEMVENCLTGRIKYTVAPIPDIHNHGRWVEHVEKIVPEFDVVYANNLVVKQLFEEKGYKVKNIPLKKTKVNATSIRNAMLKNEPYEHYVPEGSLKVLNKINANERIKAAVYKQPGLAVDIITEIDNKLLLIERKNKPYGWALPGGKVDYGENVETAAVREMLEETSLHIYDLKLFGVYSDPDRDPRQHMVSIVFTAKAKGEPKAGDDAKNLALFEKGNLPEMAFDHNKIIKDFLGGYKHE